MPFANNCPTDVELINFSQGQRSPEQSNQIATHLEGCKLCEEKLQAIDSQGSSLEAALRHTPKPPAIGSQTEPLTSDAPSTFTGIGMIVGGRYKLVEAIGEGGMGSVYMAQQSEPIRRLVAVKLIKEGMDSRQVLARFEAERQALALMDHPNIAKVLDAGVSSTGRPYFVMELVKGIPITRYCDEHKLTTRERLELFVGVCRAIQHAHQKGIIHRDIKPGNVLVAMFDGRPVPKVIDFGVAKAVGQPLTDRTLVTNFGAVVGTPEYMSPEQAELNPNDIDTRSDVFSLGVLLYEILTGSTPLQRARLGRAAVLEVLRLVREEEPPRLSTRLSSSDALASLAATRRIDPQRLTALMRGELDWIAMRALEKDRNRRYDTANGLARDIERYLADEPVEACPPTVGYRLTKFVRRNKVAIVVSTAFVMLLIAGIAATSVLALITDRARVAALDAESEMRKARDRAIQAEAQERSARESAQQRLTQVEKANELLTAIFKDLNPKLEVKESRPLLAILGDRLAVAAETLEGTSVGDPLSVARMQLALGASLKNLGATDKAIHVLEKSMRTFEANLGLDHPDTRSSRNELASAYKTAKRLDESIAIHEALLKSYTNSLGADHPDTLSSRNNLAEAYRAANRLPEVIAMHEGTLKLAEAKFGAVDPKSLISRNNLAGAYNDMGRVREAIAMHEETLKRFVNALGETHVATLACRNNLAEAYRSAGHLAEAITMHEGTQSAFRAKLGPDHPNTLQSGENLASVYSLAGKDDLAEPYYRTLLEHVRTQSGPPGERVALYSLKLGLCLVQQRKFTEAELLLRQALSIREKDLPKDWSTSDARSVLGACLMGQGKFVDAEPLIVGGYEGLKAVEAQLPAWAKPRLTEATKRVCQLYEKTDRKERAEVLWKELAPNL